ncbi:MAG: SURF1 family protein [Betaproteobacteria bacterium]
MPAGYSFRPRAWALAAAAAACAAGIALGLWQVNRAEEKRKAEARAERISVRGEFLPGRTVLLDNKLRRGRAGYEVVTPLKVAASGMHVLVNRGWVAAAATRDQLPEIKTPSGEIIVEGVIREHLPRVLQAGAAQRGKVRQSLAVEEFAAETGLAMLPFVIEQHSRADDGLLREWPPAAPGPEKNEMYALQWFSLAALAVVLALVLSFRKLEK